MRANRQTPDRQQGGHPDLSKAKISAVKHHVADLNLNWVKTEKGWSLRFPNGRTGIAKMGYKTLRAAIKTHVAESKLSPKAKQTFDHLSIVAPNAKAKSGALVRIWNQYPHPKD